MLWICWEVLSVYCLKIPHLGSRKREIHSVFVCQVSFGWKRIHTSMNNKTIMLCLNCTDLRANTASNLSHMYISTVVWWMNNAFVHPPTKALLSCNAPRKWERCYGRQSLMSADRCTSRDSAASVCWLCRGKLNRFCLFEFIVLKVKARNEFISPNFLSCRVTSLLNHSQWDPLSYSTIMFSPL